MPAVTPATAEDLPNLVALRDAAARWQQQRGIEQWEVGELTESDFATQAERGELFLVHNDSQVLGAVRIIFADPMIWPDTDASAGYVHGLMTAERGTGLGATLLDWAEDRIRETGRNLARLDCVQANHRLRSYYRSRGYREVGPTTFDNPRFRPVMRFEKPL